MVEDNNNKDQELSYSIMGGKLLANPPPGEDVVISGLSGAFPESRNVHEFRDNLYNKVNMVTNKNRWEYSHQEIPICTGTVPEIDKYDTGFFGVHERQSHSLDTMCRMFQEKAIEAILDAGLHPSDLENTKTGVYVGACFSESDKTWLSINLTPDAYAITGTERSMLAHRLSYFLKLKGPSYIADTACSSSLYAFEHAYRAIRMGQIDNAIIGGTNMCIHPFVSLQFSRLGVLSHDGSCKAFDKSGDGYARSEAIVALLLQKSKNAKRIYAHVVHAKTGCDGYKPQGITYPSGAAQVELLNDFYDECTVDRYSLSFLEAHGTGTFVGDPEEGTAIDVTLTKNRKTPLLIGSVKSNIGHSEPVSGMCSITKCIIGMEEGFIPPNIHFSVPRDELKGLVEGRMKVVTEKMPFVDNKGLLGINSFGFGGGNCHILLHWNEKEKLNKGLPKDNLPRLVCVSGRTEEAVVSLLDELGKNILDAEHITLLYNVFRKPINNHLYRGYVLVSKAEEIARSLKYSPEGELKPLYLVFGDLNKWQDVGNHLLELPVFADCMQRIQQHMAGKGIHILDVLQRTSVVKDEDHILGSLVVQIGVIEVLNLLEIKPTGSFGYSFGELLSAYYDKVLTLEETVKYGLIINEALQKISVYSNGLYPNDQKYQNQDINGTNMVNGNNLNGYETRLEDLKVILNTNNQAIRKESWFQNLADVLGKVKPWNSKTSKSMNKSSDRFIDSLIANSPSDTLEECTNFNSIVLKIGSSPIYAKEDVSILTFPNAESSKNYVIEFLKTIGSLYEHGHNPQIAKLYPSVELPVSRGTRMISPYIQWKHDRNLFYPEYSLEVANNAQHGARCVSLLLSDQEWAYLEGHIVDGRNLFPATAYLYLVWEAFSFIKGVTMNVMNVVFENCKFIRATTLSKKGVLQFNVTILKNNGSFEVVEGDSPVVTGRIYTTDTQNNIEAQPSQVNDNIGVESEALPLTTKDVYKELRLRGYHYKGAFRAIQECDITATKGYIKWENNFVTFMDNMLQMKILQADSRLLYVPTYIAKLVINGQRHMEWIDTNYTKTGKVPNLPVFNNPLTGTISAGGIWMQGLIASSINKRKDLAVPVLERYIFIPNSTNLNIEQSVRVNTQIILENALVYKVNAVELIDEFSGKDLVPLTPIIRTVLEDQPLIQPIVKILSKTPLDVGVEVEDKKLSSESNCLIVIASKILSRPETLKEALTSLIENGFIISREPYEYNISKEVYSGVTILTVHRTQSETLLLLQKQNETKQSTIIKVTSTGSFSWVPTVQEAIKKNDNDDIILCSESEPNSGVLGLVNCLRREPNGKSIKCIFVAEPTKELNLSQLYKNQLKKNMAINIYKNGQWGTYRHLLLNGATEVESEHCFVNVLVRGDLSSLRWIQGPLRHDRPTPPERLLVDIYYAALNFRDIMTSLGKVNVDVVTQDRREQECIQGFEFSGRDQRGNRIMGMVTSGALASEILADPYLCFKVPDAWTMAEGATIMTVYGTVIYALVVRGQLKRNDTILIHSGTGGIGQAAITFASHYGCKIYTTVGTQEKREFLKKHYPHLKDCQIGNSHDESFEQMIFQETNGRGVDMVLNSLAEDKLIASVRCLARGGRFIEIGKFDMAVNSYLNTLLFRKEASFHGVMLDQLFSEKPSVKHNIMQIVNEGIKNGSVKPLNHKIFKMNEVEQAFRFMASGKHTGKVLIEVRKPEKEIIATAPPQKFTCMARYLCDPEKTYVIVGGLGGFGLELADWLVLRGATKLVLTSRKGVSTGYQNLRISIWSSYGTVVKISQANVTTKAGCKQLIEECQELGPIGAIFNLAVVLADALFENQTPESFVTSFQPKAYATQYLDELTRTMCPDLNQFVVFSSVSCGRGNAGQTNYGMANSVMERICEKRKQDGYPALAIEWGAVGEVGLVADMQDDYIELEIGGTLQQRISNCLNVLDTLLIQDDTTIVSSMVVAEKRGSAATDNIVDAVINILGLNDSKCVSLHSTLPELGMDSMTAVEIKQTLEREYEVFLTAKDIRTMTLARLKEMHEDKSGSNQTDEATGKDAGYMGLEMFITEITDEAENKIPYKRLKSNVDETEAAPKILLFPGIESVSRIYENLSKQLDAHVIYIQLIVHSEEHTVMDMTNSVMPYVEEHVSKDEPFNIVAYSFGSLIAVEVVNILESRGYIGKLVCIDGAPLLMKEMLVNFNKESGNIFETALICQLLTLYLSTEIVKKHEEEIFKCNSWEEKVTLGIDIVKQYKAIDQTHQRNVANGIYWRINALRIYNPPLTKLKANASLLKAEQEVVPGLSQDYNLSQLFEKPIEVQKFDGNHVTILDNESLAVTINSFINSTSDQR